MCGILGGIGDKITKDMVKIGLLELESRGKDATGIYQPETGILKNPIPASEFVDSEEFNALKMDKMFLAHCRAWTKGRPANNENNHPFQGEKWVLIHNGVVTMDSVKDYNYKGECDSEVLLSHIETLGLKEGVQEVEGSAAILVAPTDKTYEMWLWRHTSPIEVAYSKTTNTFLAASSREALRMMVARPVLSGLLYDFKDFVFSSVDEHELWRVFLNDKGKVTAEYHGEFKPKVKPTKAYCHVGSYNGYERGNYYGNYYEWNNKQNVGFMQSRFESKETIPTGAKMIDSSDDDKEDHPCDKCRTIPGEVPGFSRTYARCKDCAFFLDCEVEAEKSIHLANLDFEGLIAYQECNNVYIPSTKQCRTCPARTLCNDEIQENWMEDDPEDMYILGENRGEYIMSLASRRQQEENEREEAL